MTYLNVSRGVNVNVNMACNCFDGHLALGICRNRSADLEVGEQNTNNANVYS